MNCIVFNWEPTQKEGSLLVLKRYPKIFISYTPLTLREQLSSKIFATKKLGRIFDRQFHRQISLSAFLSHAFRILYLFFDWLKEGNKKFAFHNSLGLFLPDSIEDFEKISSIFFSFKKVLSGKKLLVKRRRKLSENRNKKLLLFLSLRTYLELKSAEIDTWDKEWSEITQIFTRMSACICEESSLGLT